jgi:hypothetical protein
MQEHIQLAFSIVDCIVSDMVTVLHQAWHRDVFFLSDKKGQVSAMRKDHRKSLGSPFWASGRYHPFSGLTVQATSYPTRQRNPGQPKCRRCSCMPAVYGVK